jgi:hypothetical protein
MGLVLGACLPVGTLVLTQVMRASFQKPRRGVPEARFLVTQKVATLNAGEKRPKMREADAEPRSSQRSNRAGSAPVRHVSRPNEISKRPFT